jgi:hypothetical protein
MKHFKFPAGVRGNKKKSQPSARGLARVAHIAAKIWLHQHSAEKMNFCCSYARVIIEYWRTCLHLSQCCCSLLLPVEKKKKKNEVGNGGFRSTNQPAGMHCIVLGGRLPLWNHDRRPARRICCSWL